MTFLQGVFLVFGCELLMCGTEENTRIQGRMLMGGFGLALIIDICLMVLKS